MLHFLVYTWFVPVFVIPLIKVRLGREGGCQTTQAPPV